MPRFRPEFLPRWSSNPLHMTARLSESRTEGGYVETNGEVITKYGIVLVSAGYNIPNEASSYSTRWGYAHFQFLVKGTYVSYSAEGEPRLTKRQLAYWAKRTIAEAHDAR